MTNKRPMSLETNFAIAQSSRSCTYTLSTPRGGGGGWSKLTLFSLYGQRFLRSSGTLANGIYICTHILSFYPRVVEIELIFHLWAVCSKIQADFQKKCHIWAWILGIGQSSRSCTYNLFLPQRVKIELFSLYGQRFPRYSPFSKLS